MQRGHLNQTNEAVSFKFRLKLAFTDYMGEIIIVHKYAYALLRVLFASFKPQTSYAVYVKVIKTVQREFQGQMKGQIDYLVCSKKFLEGSTSKILSKIDSI